MRPKPILLSLFLLIAAPSGMAQSSRIQALTTADGLSQGYVSSLFQDSRGFIWIGTYNGLNRYDGYEVRVYEPNNTAPWSLKANYIFSISEDRQGLLWLGTDKGVAVMDPYSERVVHLAGRVSDVPSGEVLQLDADRNGQIWLTHRQPGESGLCVFRPPNDLVRRIRENALLPTSFGVQPVRLAESLARPLRWSAALNDTTRIAADSLNHLCLIRTPGLQATSATFSMLPYHKIGNYGLVYAQNRSSGWVFHLEDDTSSDPGNWTRSSDFIELPDGQRFLMRAGLQAILRLEIREDFNAAAGYEQTGFYHQFPAFVQVGKPMSNATLLDRSGNLWVGTVGYGARKISQQSPQFRQYLPEKSVYNFTVLPDGRIWPGIFCPFSVLNVHTGVLEPAPWNKALPHNTWAHTLLLGRQGDWWMAARSKGRFSLLHKPAGNGSWSEIQLQLAYQKDVPVQLLEDRRGMIWMAGNKGQVVRIRPDDNNVDTWWLGHDFPAQANLQLRSNCLVEDSSGRLWIGCNYGLIQVNHPEMEPDFEVFHNYSKKGPLFRADGILCILPDANDPAGVWLGTYGGGLHYFNTQTGACAFYTVSDGLSDNVVYGILQDSSGLFWLSTNRGISCFDPRSRRFIPVLEPDSPLNNEFNTGAYRRLPSGELAFGSVNGLFVLPPAALQKSQPPGAVAITRLSINGTVLDLAQADARCHVTPINTYQLRLPYDQNNVVVEFAAVPVNNPALAQYRYRVVGLNDHWVEIGRQHVINLAGLPPGEYIVELQRISLNTDWANVPVASLHLQIKPPWYRSWGAILFYLVLASWLIYAYIRYERKRLQLRHTVEISQKEMDRLKSLDDFKNRFFTYVAHEFKTPLTIILGMAERLRRENNQGETATYTEGIVQQGRNMLELVDQLIDMTRQQERALYAQWQQGNISDYIQFLVESFRALADFRDIRLEFGSAAPDLVMDFDPLRLKFIVSNLLTNAIRHTTPGGSIRVTLKAATPALAQLIVADTGEGIATADLPYVFERYFQGQGQAGQAATHHFGLGLAFVKDLVELFQGEIQVESQVGKGTTFTISLPVRREASVYWNKSDNAPSASVSLPKDGVPAGPAVDHLPLLLVVEDNPVIASYLQFCLQAHFRLMLARDGNEGWENALEQLPDLVLTDVMLPGLDGLALTKRIKTHELTSHIPVVMLSARAELADRLSGHQQGADAYLAKPFHEQELVLILQNLFALQQQWKKRYSDWKGPRESPDHAPHEGPSGEAVQHTDAFMRRLYAAFEQHYAAEAFDLAQLCQALNISKSQLQRKLATVSNQSAMELLREYRLLKAYELLKQYPDLHVKEVCFRVGFKDPAHFSRLFSRMFQIAPSEMKQLPPNQ